MNNYASSVIYAPMNTVIGDPYPVSQYSFCYNHFRPIEFYEPPNDMVLENKVTKEELDELRCRIEYLQREIEQLKGK